LSQKELADRAGLSRRRISDLERGARRVPYLVTVRRLAEALGLTEPDRAVLLGAAHARGGARHNLPAQPTSFVGPRRELAEVLALMNRHRLVTLTGTGGSSILSTRSPDESGQGTQRVYFSALGKTKTSCCPPANWPANRTGYGGLSAG
jgi:transcriptional regulator with XRE-family HTH domain